MSRIRVLLVDDHTIVRQGLRRLLETDPEIEIVGETGDGRTAVAMVEQVRPHLVVMDLAIPEVNGIEATRQIVEGGSGARVLILTMHSDDVSIRQSLKAGARGYLLKDSADILKAAKAIARGGSFFSPAVSKLLRAAYVDEAKAREIEDNLDLLTEREQQVLRLIAEGKTNRAIAGLMSVSVNTVETHRKHIMEKLDLHNTAEIVRFAVRKKVVS